MHLWTFLFLLPAQAVESKDFPKALQMQAVAATVRIANRSERSEGTGVMIGRKEGAVYVLTAAHLVARGDRLEISTFSDKSYPQPVKTYDKVEVLLRTRDIRDLALLRIITDDAVPALMPLCLPRKLPTKGSFTALSVGCGASRTPMCMLEKVSKEKKIRRPPGREMAHFWEAEVEQAAGRSGGPLLDTEGRLIGVASGASEGKGYYAHGAEIHGWLKGSTFSFLLEENENKEKE
jgi:S1-C subfamily serine protease